MNTDFIEDMNNKPADELHIEGLCHELARGRNIYDGSNPYGSVSEITYNGITFTPTIKEIRAAMDEFEKKGWFGTYDSDVGFYAVYKEEPTLGEYQRRFTRFLFRPSFAA